MIASVKWFLLISNCFPLPVVVRKFFQDRIFLEEGCCSCWQQCIGAKYKSIPKKWGSNYALKPNMVDPKFQHRTPFALPTKLTLKLAVLHCLLTLHHLQIILPLSPPLLNEYMSLQHITWHLWNLHTKTCTHYLCRYFSRFYFTSLLSTQSYKYYVSWYGSDNSPLLVDFGKWAVKYSC